MNFSLAFAFLSENQQHNGTPALPEGGSNLVQGRRRSDGQQAKCLVPGPEHTRKPGRRVHFFDFLRVCFCGSQVLLRPADDARLLILRQLLPARRRGDIEPVAESTGQQPGYAPPSARLLLGALKGGGKSLAHLVRAGLPLGCNRRRRNWCLRCRLSGNWEPIRRCRIVPIQRSDGACVCFVARIPGGAGEPTPCDPVLCRSFTASLDQPREVLWTKELRLPFRPTWEVLLGLNSRCEA